MAIGDGDAQKMTELKKAYASVILHTTQEAAARILASDRRAFRFQRAAVDAKEEALRMLLRLRQSMDSKIYEAEVLSLGQKKKIKELEGQLQEAENVVRELRQELAAVKDELEIVKRREQSQSLDDKISNRHACGSENTDTSHNTKLDASESIFDFCSDSIVILSPKLSSEGNSSTLAQGKDESQLLKTRGSGLMTRFRSTPYLPSIIRRTKSPPMYSNGFAQVSYAMKENKLGGAFCSSDEVDYSKKELFVDSEMYSMPTENEDSIFGGKKAQGDLIHNDAILDENSSKCSKSEPRRGLELSLPTNTCNLKTRSGNVLAKENSDNFVKACSLRKTAGNGEKEAKVLTREGDAAVQCLGAEVGTMGHDFDIIRSNSNAEADNVKSNKGCFPFTTDVIKYTRKRNRAAMDSGARDKSFSPEHVSLKRKTSNVQVDIVSSLHKHTSDVKSSKNWESQKVAQVAHQLLALSDKKWFR